MDNFCKRRQAMLGNIIINACVTSFFFLLSFSTVMVSYSQMSDLQISLKRTEETPAAV